jgi:hypothetical protein
MMAVVPAIFKHLRNKPFSPRFSAARGYGVRDGKAVAGPGSAARGPVGGRGAAFILAGLVGLRRSGKAHPIRDATCWL